MLNYLYAILEAEARLAILAVGCDPGLGVLHSDIQARDSLACDVMETVRPEVDALLLDILTTRSFKKADFFERRDGMCRVMPPTTHQLAETGPRWRNALAPIAEHIAQRFMDTASYNPSPGSRKAIRKPKDRSPFRHRVPTKLTQSRRRVAQEGKPRSNAKPKGTPIPKTCVGCGGPLKQGDRRWCMACWEPQQPESMAKARTVLREQRASGLLTGKKLGERQGNHRRTVSKWNRENERPDPAIFEREIWPKLKSLQVIALVRATGLSYGYCNQIKLGHKTPHPRWWRGLRSLA